MKTWNAQELQRYCEQSSFNLVLHGELMVRHQRASERYSRVLWLSRRDPEANGGTGEGLALCVEVDLTPSNCGDWGDPQPWQEQVAPVMLRLSNQPRPPRGTDQYRLVQQDSFVYRDIVPKLVRGVGPSLSSKLMGGYAFVPEIDWRMFLQHARVEGEQLVCSWKDCKYVRADLSAKVNRQLERPRRIYDRTAALAMRGRP